jgi:hypothetical protein
MMKTSRNLTAAVAAVPGDAAATGREDPNLAAAAQ